MKAFADFDFANIAEVSENDVERLLKDDGIVRHRGKFIATFNNARPAIEIVEDCARPGGNHCRREP